MTSYGNQNEDIIDQMRKGLRPWITILIIAANIVVYVLTVWTGSVTDSSHMLSWGAAYEPLIRQGEYYRLFTSMFLHFGISHLANNMLLLVFVGYYLETYVGHTCSLFIYLLGGIGGNIVSVLYDMHTGNAYVSAGASGAVFAILGALLVVALIRRNSPDTLRASRLLLMILFSVYVGFSSAGVDGWAHMGGLIFGALMCLILFPFWKNHSPVS